MATLPWIDFTAHNARTQENVRAFSVNHPQAGRLVVIKGVEPSYEASLQAIGFTLTRDGSFVIQASNLNMRQLQSQVFPGLQMRQVDFAQIDMTEQFLNPQPIVAPAERNPGMEYLLNNQQATETEGLNRYAGPMPSAVAVSLWDYLDNNAQAAKQPNGQIHYRGAYRDQAFIVQRRQRLLSDVERVIFHGAPSVELLPDLQTSSQAPELFRLSDIVSAELQAVEGFYGAAVNGNKPAVFVPDHRLGTALAQRSINDAEALEGQLLSAQFPTTSTLALADAPYDTGLSVRHLTEIMGGDETNALLIDLPRSGWITLPESENNPASSPNARINASVLSELPGLMVSAENRGFTAVAYYREEPLSAELPASTYVSSDSVALYVRALPRTEVQIQRQVALVNQNRVPDGYTIEYGQGQREGTIRLVFDQTGEAVSENGNVWFNSLEQAVAALSLPHNQPFQAPNEEEINAALDEAFASEPSSSEIPAEAPETTPAVTDPALDPERVRRMAQGANQREERERQQREEWHKDSEQRLEAIEARQPTWQDFEGVQVMRIGEEPFVAVPATGRVNSRRFDIIDIRDRTEPVTQLKKSEVSGWLYQAGADFAEGETTSAPTASLTAESATQDIERHLQTVRLHAETAIVKTPEDRAAYLSEHRGQMIQALQEIRHLSTALREMGESPDALLNGRIPDLVVLEDPVLTEVMDTVLDEDVSLELDTLSADQANRAALEATEDKPDAISAPATESVLGEDALIELSQSAAYDEAGISLETSAGGKGLDVYYTRGGTNLVGHAQRFQRSSIITGILTHRAHPTDPTPTLIQQYRERDDLPLALRQVIDEAYAGRIDDVIQLLGKAGYSNINEATDGQGIAITVNTQTGSAGTDKLLTGVEWVVGETTFFDDLELTVDELAESIRDTAAAMEQAQADTALEGEENAVFDSTWPKNPESYSIEHFDGIEPAQEALLRGDIIDVYGEEVYVRPSSFGWVIKTRSEGATVTKGGDPRGGGHSRSEAVESASEMWQYLPHFRNAPAAETVVETETEAETEQAEQAESTNPPEASVSATENRLIAQANEQVPVFALATEAIDLAQASLDSLVKPTNADQGTLDAYHARKNQWLDTIEVFESTLISGIDPFEMIDRGDLPGKIRTRFEERFAELSPEQMGEHALQARREIVERLRSQPVSDDADAVAEAKAEATSLNERETDGFIPFGSIRSARNHIENNALQDSHQALETDEGAVVRPRIHPGFDINSPAELPGDVNCKSRKEAAQVLATEPERYSHLVKRGSQWLVRQHNTGVLLVRDSQAKAHLYDVWTTPEGLVVSGYPGVTDRHGPPEVKVEREDIRSLIEAMQEAPQLEHELVQAHQAQQQENIAQRTDELAQQQQQYAEQEQALGGIRLQELGALDLESTKRRFQRLKKAGEDTRPVERTLRALRQSIFEAEEAMVAAFEQRDPSVFEPYKELFPLAAKRLADMPGVDEKAPSNHDEAQTEDAQAGEAPASVPAAENTDEPESDELPVMVDGINGREIDLTPAQLGTLKESLALAQTDAMQGKQLTFFRMTGDSFYVGVRRENGKPISVTEVEPSGRPRRSDPGYLLFGFDDQRQELITREQFNRRVQEGLVPAPSEEPEPVAELVGEENETTVSEAEPSNVAPAPLPPMDDLFSAPAAEPAAEPQNEQPATAGNTLVIEPGANEKQFIVSGSALVQPGIREELEARGGRYVKKYAGYRFNAKEENSVRWWLKEKMENAQLQLDERIRTPFELSEGARLPSGKVIKKLEFSSVLGTVRLEYGALNDGSDIIRIDTDISGLELAEKVTVTNAEQLERELSLALQTEQSEPTIEPVATVEPVTPSEEPQESERDAPALRVIAGDQAPAELVNDAAGEAPREHQERMRTLRGKAVSPLGKNTDGVSIYADKDGLRYSLDSSGNLREETAVLGANAQALPPQERDEHFMLASELVNDASQAGDNIVPLFASEEPEAEPISDEVREQASNILQQIGYDREFAKMHLQAYVAVKDYAAEHPQEDLSKDFTFRRLQQELNKVEHTMAGHMRAAGYQPKPQVFEYFRNRLDEMHEKVSSAVEAIVEVATVKSISELPGLTSSDVKHITREQAQALAPSWLYERLKKMPQPYRSLMIAKAYGDETEIEAMLEVVDSQDEEAREVFSEHFEQKYAKHRALVELPDRIRELSEFIETTRDDNSPIPRTIAEKEVRELRARLAQAQFDVDAVPIDDEDKTTYRSHYSSEDAAQAAAERHGMSVEAAYLFNERVSEAISLDARRAYMATEEVAVGQDMPDALRALPGVSDDLVVQTSIETGRSSHRIPWGAGHVTVGFPTRNEDREGYSVYFSYTSGHRDYDVNELQEYATLPSAETLARDTAALLMRYQVASIDINKAPEFGAKRDSLAEGDTYSLTECAKRVRTDLKEAINAGVLPKGLKVSVSKANNLSPQITAVPEGFPIINPDYVAYIAENPHDHFNQPSRYTHEAMALVEAVKRYTNAYNSDKSDIMVDIHNRLYSGHISISYDLTQQAQAEIQAAQIPESLELKNRVYPLLAPDVFKDLHRLHDMGFVYLEGRETPLTLDPQDPSENGNGFSDHLGRGVDVEGLDPMFVLAVNRLRGAYQQLGKPFYRAEIEAAEQPEEESPVTASEAEDNDLSLVREAIEALEITESIEARHSAQFELAPKFSSLPALELRIDPGIATVVNGPTPIATIDTDAPGWDVLSLTDDARTLLRAVADDRYSVRSKQRRTIETTTDGQQIQAQYPEAVQAQRIHDELFQAVVSANMDPTPIPSVTTFGAHFVGAKRGEDGLWDAVLATSTVAGDHKGVIIEGSGFASYEQALAGVAKRYEDHAKHAYRHNQAPGMCDAISVLTYLEKHIEENDGQYQAQLLDDQLRAIARKGGVALIRHYEQLVTEQGATPSDSDILSRRTITLIPASERNDSTQIELAQLASGHYVFGADIALPDGKRISLPTSAENELYTGPEKAAGAFLTTINDLAPSMLDACAEALYNQVPIAATADHEMPDIDQSKASKLAAELTERIEQLNEQIRQGDFQDPAIQELVGMRDGLEVQREGCYAVEIHAFLRNHPAATLELAPQHIAQSVSQYQLVRRAYNEQRIVEEQDGSLDSQQLRQQWLEATSMDSTHEVTAKGIAPRADLALPENIGELQVIERYRNSGSEPIYLIDTGDLDANLAQVLVNAARLSGGLEVDRELIFSDLDSLEKFVEQNALEYRIQTETLDEPQYNTQVANANLEPWQIQELHTAGYIQTEQAHAWVILAEDDVSVRVEFYRGVDGTTVDAQVKFAGPNFRREAFLSALPAQITAAEITDKLNAELLPATKGKVIAPALAPTISTISGEKACAMVLAAGMNIEQRSDPNMWVISGDTFARRHTLYNLGGKYYSPERGKAIWVFRENPVLRLGAALAGQVTSQEAVQTQENGYILRVGTNGNDNHFVTRAYPEALGPDAALIVTSSSSLSQARTGTLTPILEPERLDKLFAQANAQREQAVEHRGDAEAAPQAPAQENNTVNQAATDTPKETSNAQTNDRPADRTAGIPAAGNAAGAGQRQPRMDSGAGADVPADVAGQGRGADRAGSRPSGRPVSGQQERTVDDHGSPAAADTVPRSAQRDDGRTLRDAEPRELFDFRGSQPDGQLDDNARGEYTLAALDTLLTLREHKRSPTPEERQALARFVGLGAKQFNGKNDGVFVGRWNNRYESLNDRIAGCMKRFLDSERNSLQSTVLTAFYTPADIRQFMWQGLERLGVNDQLKRLDLVEPAAGTGHFLGDAPDFVRNGARIQAIEIDPVTAEIAQHLYPEAQIINKPFQDVQFPANSKDVFIGNPPYSDVRTYNPASGKREVIHDLFLRESIKATRPGGIVAFVTSSGTMDKANDEMRAYVASHADLVHAVRLPTSAFNEAGTEVMTDILFFRKRLPQERPQAKNWVNTTSREFTLKDETVELPVNQYFVDNPQNVIGELKAVSGRFGPSLSCSYNGDLSRALSDQLSNLPEGVFNPQRSLTARVDAGIATDTAEEVGEELMEQHRIGSWYLDDSDEVRLIQYDGSQAKYFSEAVKLNSKQAVIAKDYIGLRDLAKSLVEAESAPEGRVPDDELVRLREQVNESYDRFVQAHGPVNRKVTLRLLQADPDAYFVAALENYDKELDQAEKADILKHRVIRPEITAAILTPEDALYASMSTYGHVDPEFVEQALSRPWDEVEAELGEAIFLDPESGKYTTPSVYLSGDVIHKREVAERALIDNPALERNIEALKAAQPKTIPVTDIHVKLGATWLPEDLVQDFARTLVNAKAYPHNERLTVNFNDLLKEWQVKATDALRRDRSTEFTIEHGTEDVPFHKLLLHSLTQTRPRVYVEDIDGNRVVSQERTQQACDKQVELEERFRSWVLEDNTRARKIQDAYNYRLNRFVRPEPDGRYLTFPGVTEELKGRPFAFDSHQLGVIERALTSPYGTLLAHEAGGGKTISTTAIAIKHKQLGLAKKPMIAVPNHMLVQYTKEALDLYPNARILTVTPDDLTKQGRALFAQKCRLNDWDLVICTHSQYQRMSMPPEYVQRDIDRQLDELETMLIESDDRITTKELERKKKTLNEKLKEINAKIEAGSDDVDFTELGVDFVGYDEGHYLKNMDLPTKNRGLPGINSRDAVRSRDSLMKFDWIRETRGDGKGVLLATGTPLSNTVGEIMVMMRYLAPELLERAGIHNLDQFIANYGHIQTHLELTADGSSYQTKERLSGFRNIPELMRLFTQVADIKMGDQLNIKRPNENRVTHVTELTPQQQLFMDWLGHRARGIKNKVVKPTEDNMLNIYTDLRKSGVDMRLIHHKLDDHPKSKINELVETFYQRWKDGSDNLDTQLVFLDFLRQSTKVKTGTTPDGRPKFKTVENLHLYKDIKNKLVAKGVPAKEIAFIHDAKTDEDKEQLFERMRSGKVRLTLASTEKMGVGTNVQTRLKDLYHVSLPMRSTDMEQRNKRAVRQGNTHDEVNLHFPVTRGSGDLVSLQMLDRKEKMVRQVMECDFENMLRSFDDDCDPSYEELMALTTNNPIIKEKIETDTRVEELQRKRRGHEHSTFNARSKLAHLEHSEMVYLHEQLEGVEILKATVGDVPEEFEMTINGETLTKYAHVGAETHRAWNRMSAYQNEKELGDFHGLPIKLITDKDYGAFLVAETPGKDKNIAVRVTESLSGFPKNLVEKIKERCASADLFQERIDSVNQQIDHLKQLSEAPYPHQEELDKLLVRQKELNTEFSKWESENKPEVKQEGWMHPFEILLKKLNGEDVSQEESMGALNYEQIQEALAAEHEDEPNQEKEDQGPNLTLV
ncbi:N-6 DNA methylase [Marinimicrobium sp. ABcell2]|uniref:N-6 DNA methylase n=1 Tax=Marinimicrobium sp. ABcell2 TaxID=3069751 RepID=UPI0027AF9EB6|nr:N-6 DNA methylase [Marinimicrobium sp. ABcell2]MDQ2077540.1 N-6 DNA methylase [Marinimicrobium sp. ABcell2]